MPTLVTILGGVLVVAFTAAGFPKVARTEHYRQRVRHWQLPQTLLPAIGATELGAAALLLGGLATEDDRLVAAGLLIMAGTMLAALGTHIRVGDPARASLPACVLGALAVTSLALVAS